MTLQNRVDPFGQLHAQPARGGLTGNRGILHDEARVIRRHHGHHSWIACSLSYKGRRRVPMTPGRWTELFFLDEPTALAAGHRPCATCRRARYRAFTAAWVAAHGPAPEGTPLPRAIDRALHAARYARGVGKITCQTARAGLPDGAIFCTGGAAMLAWQGADHPWGFSGYGPARAPAAGDVTLLTPAPLLPLLHHGYRPEPPRGLAP